MISTTTSLASSSNPSTYGGSITLTATVSPGGGGPTLTGTVTFFDGAVQLGQASVSLVSGSYKAQLSISSLKGGSRSLTASYSGDSNYSLSASSTLTQTVNKAGVASGVFALNPASPTYNTPTTLSLTLTGISGLLPPTGTVTFANLSGTLGTATLVPNYGNGTSVASLTLTFATGSQTLTATYSSDGNYTSGSAYTLSVTVGQASTTTQLQSSPDPSAQCQSVKLTATIAPAGSGTSTTTVTFKDGSTTLGVISPSSDVATFTTSSLSVGSHTLDAQYSGNSNFNSSSSPNLTQVVNSAVNWVVTAAPAAPDPQQAVILPFGSAQMEPLTGSLRRAVGFDANLHSDCGCGCSCKGDNCRSGRAPLSLVYCSNTLNVKPLFMTTLASDFCASVPSSIQAQLTWNGTAQGWVTFATTGHSAGDVYSLPLQVSSAVSSSGIYAWSIEVKTTVGGTVYDSTVSGVLPVVVNTSSPFGAGWSIGGTTALLVGSAGVAVIDNASGGFRYFSGTPGSLPFTYTSPANDQGTLVQNGDGSFTYTAKDQTQTNFDSSGRMSSQVDPHGLTQAYSYASPLSTITQPDSGVATFTYSSGMLSQIQEPGSRALTMAYDGSGNLVSLTDATGALYTFSYDGANRLTNDQVGPINTTYTYSGSNGTLTQINRGLSTTLSVAASAAQGLGASTAINVSASAAALTDALSNTTSYALDSLGRLTQLQTADGALQTWTLDAAGNPTVYIDQLGRVTSYTYNGSEDLTQIAFPDGTYTTYQYETTFHQVKQIQDALSHYTTMTYDGTYSDLLTQKDALGNVATYTWSGGLMQTMTDARGNVTTSTWDSTKRRQLTMQDALLNVTSYGYDSAGNQNQVQDARGNYTTYTYDGNRRPLTQTNALLGVRTYAYDAVGNQTSLTDELGRVTSYVYDQRNFQTAITEAVGNALQRTTTTTYDVAGNVSYRTDALGDITSYGYDALNRQVKQIEAYGSGVARTTTTVYDLAGNILSTIDGRGTTTSYGYDVRNRQIQKVDAYGNALQRTTTTAYDLVGNVLTVTNPLGVMTSYAYDADNRPTKRIDDYNDTYARTTTTLYDSVGNVLSVTNPVAAITSYSYDALNRQTQMIEAYGSGVARTTTTTYDAVSNVKTSVNPRAYTTSYAYDALNRRITEQDAYGNALQRTLTTTYDAVSNVLSATNGLNVTTSYGYDALNRRTKELDAYGTSLQRTLTMVYDADDNVTASIDALGFTMTYAYDALNRRISVQDPGTGIATTVYDANNNVVNTIDQLSHKTTYVYDVLNRKTATTDPRAAVVTLTYDANNNLLSLTDPVNNQTQWIYDALDRKIQEIDPFLVSSTFAYDAVDRLASQTDRLGQVITYSYDLLNRELGETWKNAGGSTVNTLTFTFDSNNNLLTAANNQATSTMSYDALDRKATVQDSFGTVLTYSYDAANNRTLVQDSFNGTTTRTYDALNRVSTMQFGGPSQTPLREDFAYTARDQVATQTRYSDLAGSTEIGFSTFTYDGVGRLTNLQHQNGNGCNLANYTNTYDLASRITSETLNGAAPTTYTYDSTDELTNDAVVTYSYDLNGNRTMTGYTTGTANQITSDGTWNYSFDKNGNLIQKTKISTGEVFSYGYDNRNRLLSAQDTTSSGVQMQATYTYDGMGQRIESAVWSNSSGTTTTLAYSYDRGEIWADSNGSGSLQTRYLRGDKVLELLAWQPVGLTTRPIGPAVALATPLGYFTTGTAWVLSDRMGSIRNVVDNTGALIDSVTYDGYGNVVSESNVGQGGVYKAFGYRYDSETGLYRPDPTQGRYYNPATGSWIGQDLIKDGNNWYTYVRNNPTNATDPTGKDQTLAVRGGSLKVKAFQNRTLGGRVEISFTGPSALKGNYFKVKQWMQLEVSAYYECPSQPSCVKKVLPQGRSLEILRMTGTSEPEHDDHGHTHESATPFHPNLQIDHGKTSDEFSVGPYQEDKEQKDTIVYWDRPTAALFLWTQAKRAVLNEWGEKTRIGNEECWLNEVELLQRFVTVVYVNQKPVATVHWDSRSENLASLQKGEIPIVDIIQVFEGLKDPKEVVRESQNQKQK